MIMKAAAGHRVSQLCFASHKPGYKGATHRFGGLAAWPGFSLIIPGFSLIIKDDWEIKGHKKIQKPYRTLYKGWRA